MPSRSKHGYVAGRVSDEGGGIDAALLDKVWKYGYSTTHATPSSTRPTSFRSFWLDSQKTAQSTLSGYGFGLPYARLHARYFGQAAPTGLCDGYSVGGDLQLVSIPAFGVDVFLTTKKLDRVVAIESGETDARVEYTGSESHR